MTTTSNGIANRALNLMGGNLPPVQGNAPMFDSSAAGVALQSLYAPAVQTVFKQYGFDFTRNVFTLSLTGNTAPMGFAFEYAYPPAAIEIWQIQPATLADVNNPLPQNWMIGNALVGGAQTKVIWSNLASAQAVLNNAPIEATWDVEVAEAVSRLLASELAMALFGKPDASQALLESGSAFETLAETRTG